MANRRTIPLGHERLLTSLTGSERRVLALRYGLEGESAHTLREVAAEFETTTSRIHTIQERALRRLRAWASLSAEVFPLDAAWRDAEAALPEGWRITSVARIADGWSARAASPTGQRVGHGTIETGPTAALLALAAKLRER